MKSTRWRWSGQIMEPVDGLAFIGRQPGADGVFVITGDSGHGMTHGTLGARLVANQILGAPSEWESIYDPWRVSPRAAGEFARENLNVARQYLDLVVGGEASGVEEVAPGSGAILSRGLSKYAAYRSPSGELRISSAKCTHLGCVVSWNSTEQSWDCPCHGSRFTPDGQVLRGPATRALEPAEFPGHEERITPTPAGEIDRDAPSDRNAKG
jgi:nitrite reductase/ring-hydroxylating ferredoxin subunit